MKKDTIKISDESGDKKYFTIIPNYIYNHSTIWDREVYCQMKRIAGENGTCWMSQQGLTKQCGISRGRLKKSIKYLIDHDWIEFVNKKEVMTTGGVQEVNEYKVKDLWDLNNSFFQNKLKGGSQKNTPSTQRGVTDEIKGGSQDDNKEDILNTKKKTTTNVVGKAKPSYGNQDVNWVINQFKTVMGFDSAGGKKDRMMAMHLLRKFSKDQVTAMLTYCATDKYAPRIGSVEKLWFKRGDIEAAFQKDNKPMSKREEGIDLAKRLNDPEQAMHEMITKYGSAEKAEILANKDVYDL